MELLGSRGKKAERAQKDVKDWTSSHNKSRRIETVLARLRLGHANITHVYLMQGQTEPPECDRCRVTTTVKHLLLECRKYVTIRNKYFRNPTLSDVLAESSDFSVDKLVLNLKETIFSTKYNSAGDSDGITSYSEIYLKTSTPMFERKHIHPYQATLAPLLYPSFYTFHPSWVEAHRPRTHFPSRSSFIHSFIRT